MDLLVSQVPMGSRFSIVAHVVSNDKGMLWCRGCSPHQEFRVQGAAAQALPGLYTFYDLEKSEDQDCCDWGEGTEMHVHLPKKPFQTVHLMDFCSGMGGFSIGSHLLGMKTAAFVEKSSLACAALQANFQSPVIHGDLGDIDTLKKVHQHKGDEFLQATCGFPCQGFSRQGDELGMEDHRSRSLCFTLQGAWFLQVDSLLLECVDHVINFPLAQRHIDHFAETASMHVIKMVFDLQEQWPVRRNRFWCHMLRKDLPFIHIPRWPVSHDFQQLGNIMPLDAIWNDMEEDQLRWDPSELAIYLDSCFGDDARLLQAHTKAPTVLHSWGHVNRPCPCGCRGAFSLARLRRGGARGFGLLSSRDGCYRHLHPAEGSLLCTVPPTYCFPMPPRSALSLLGQIAAPLQVLWIQSHVLAGLQQHFWGWTGIEPLKLLRIYQEELRGHAFTRWITPSMSQPREIHLQLAGQDQLYVIKIETPVTVGALIAAEKNLAGWGHYVIVTHQGHRLHRDVLLLPGVVYTLHHCVPRQLQSCPNPLLAGGDRAVEFALLGDRLPWTFMQAMLHSCDWTSAPKPFMLYPFRVQQFLDLGLPVAVAQSWISRSRKESGDVLLICELHGHWFFLCGLWNLQHDGLAWTLFDGLRQGQAIPWMHQLTAKLSLILQARSLGLCMGSGLSQHQPHTCGTVALLHLALWLSLLNKVDDAEIVPLHEWLLTQQTSLSAIYAGGPDALQQQLATLLASKGVPDAAAEERSRMVLTKLGHKSIQGILHSKNPWAELKAAASRPGSMFRLITPAEQQQYVAERAKTKHGANIPNHKQKKLPKGAQKSQPVHLDPNQFEVNRNHFKDPDDLPVQQIHYDDVTAEARGVALCTTDMAHRFLAGPLSISTNALALLLIDTPKPEVVKQAGLKPIVIPAKYQGTDEHTLIYGHILQLGDQDVTRESASQDSNPDVINTKVIKIQVFRDQLEMDWVRFAGAPIRALVATMESLQLCKGANCGANCNKFHPGLDENIDNVIFEVWARSFFDNNGRKASQDNAWLFTGFFANPCGSPSQSADFYSTWGLC
eukprot:s64_g43.t1